MNDPLFVQASVGCQMPVSDMQLLRWVISQQKQHQSGKGCCYTVRDAMGKNLIGLIMLQPKEQRMELSYWLSPPYWRQGLMTEGLLCVLNEWRSYHPKIPVYSCCSTGNLASIVLLEKIGIQIVDAENKNEIREFLIGGINKY